mmetsp:Transcript_31595/g.75073  ORF Transcript_31595/g.75073 Transcript_31595/m.75073 type:complete len:205 (+) Transcript_31595:526-1140(+)
MCTNPSLSGTTWALGSQEWFVYPTHTESAHAALPARSICMALVRIWKIRFATVSWSRPATLASFSSCGSATGLAWRVGTSDMFSFSSVQSPLASVALYRRRKRVMEVSPVRVPSGRAENAAHSAACQGRRPCEAHEEQIANVLHVRHGDSSCLSTSSTRESSPWAPAEGERPLRTVRRSSGEEHFFCTPETSTEVMESPARSVA